MQKLKCGDVLVFKAGDNWLSKTIAWFTDSDVSHAAMMLDDKRMVEMSASGIYVSNVEALEGDSTMIPDVEELAKELYQALSEQETETGKADSEEMRANHNQMWLAFKLLLL